MPQPGDVLDKTATEIVRAATLPTVYASRQIWVFLESTGEVVRLFGQACRQIFTSRRVWIDSIGQMALIGVNSLILVLITVAFSGMVLALYSSKLLVTWGAASFIGGGLALSIVREIGPVLTGVVVAARSGSAIAAELGSMKVSEQMDALRSLAISPVQMLVAPRIIAAVVTFPMMTVFACFVGLAGGFAVAMANGVPQGTFLDSVARTLTGYDISMGLVKAAIFGLVVILISCQQGLRTSGGATGVGRSTTNAVVISIVLIYILNFLLAWVMFGRRET